MDDAQFTGIKKEIDAIIDNLPDKPIGIMMGFGLAGAFFGQGPVDH